MRTPVHALKTDSQPSYPECAHLSPRVPANLHEIYMNAQMPLRILVRKETCHDFVRPEPHVRYRQPFE